MHDATSLLITDERTTQCALGHNPCEVYVDFNENTVDLWDVTDKARRCACRPRPTRTRATRIPAGRRADQRHIFVHDETEEISRGLFTQIYTMNVDDLRNPFIVASYQGPDTTTDHNGYTKGNLLYVSHYRRGLVVFDVSDPTQLREVASFDTFLAPAGNSAGTDGAWGVYPFLSVRHGRDQRHQQRALRAARQRGGAFPERRTHRLCGATRRRSSENGGNARLIGAPECAVRRAPSASATRPATSRRRRHRLHRGDRHAQLARGRHGRPHDRRPARERRRDEADETFRVTLSNATGGATIEGSATLDVQITNDDAASTRRSAEEAAAGEAAAFDLLGAAAVLASGDACASAVPAPAHDGADQVRLGNDRDPQDLMHRET